MRRTLAVMLAAGLSIGSVASTVAQDPVGDEDPGLQRIEIPEAGVGVSLPADWSVDVEMRQREDWGLYDEGLADEPVPFWSVIYASLEGWPWCDLTWYPSHPLTLAQHAERYVALMAPSTDVERPIESRPTVLPAGEAYRFVIFNGPSDDHTTVYLLAAGDARYFLQCVDTERAEDDWLPLAESLVLLEATTDEVGAE